MDGREPIPILMKKFNVRIPTINSVPLLGLKRAGLIIGGLLALTYTGLLMWSLLPPTRLAALPALNLLWSIFLIVGIVKKKPILLLPALGSAAIAITVLTLFVIIDGFIFMVLVTVQWKFSDSEYIGKFVTKHIGDFDWKYSLFDFYLNLCLTVFLLGLWIIIYSLLRSMQGEKTETNGVELDVKFKSTPIEHADIADACPKESKGRYLDISAL